MVTKLSRQLRGVPMILGVVMEVHRDVQLLEVMEMGLILLLRIEWGRQENRMRPQGKLDAEDGSRKLEKLKKSMIVKKLLKSEKCMKLKSQK